MPILKIARLGHPIVRTPAAPVPPDMIGRPPIQALIGDMIETLLDRGDPGLAAPQVHVAKQIIALCGRPTDGDWEMQGVTVLINPRIALVGQEQDEAWEACPSVEELFGRVPRHRQIQAEGLTPTGDRITIAAHGAAARVIQHEVDHLQGKVFIDRMSDLHALAYRAEYLRFWEHTREGHA